MWRYRISTMNGTTLLFILLIFLNYVFVFSQDLALQKHIFGENEYEISINLPITWKITEGEDLGNGYHLLTKVESETSAIAIQIIDVYKLSDLENENIDRNQYDSIFYQEFLDSIVKTQLERISVLPIIEIQEQKIKNIGSKKAAYAKYLAEIITENNIKRETMNEQYIVVHNGIMFSIIISSYTDVSQREIGIIDSVINSISFDAQYTEVSKHVSKPTESLFARLLRAGYRSLAYGIVILIITVIIGVFKVIKYIVNKKGISEQPDWIKRREMVWKLDDVNKLKEIADNDPDERVRDAAKDKLAELNESHMK
jgi:hypothetical protein